MEVFIVFAVFYIPFFTWLSLAYIRYKRNGIVDSKRKRIYIGFLLFLSIFHFFNNILFKLNASYGLPVTTSIVLLFSIYMLKSVTKDKKSVVDTKK